ncbi:MAG: protein kinase [Lachnospiraceae bacterium]|nr:protein kinase [Lachnospiraceae bacterium]
MKNCIFDKYETVYTVYESSATKIVLIRNRLTDEFFILKMICKSSNLAFPNYFSEAELLEGLSHPAIPSVIDRYEDDGYIYLVEEYVSGESLRQYLQDHQRITTKEFFNLIEKICQVLIYLHENTMGPILYLDLKPEHIFFEGDKLRLVDFGSAIIMNEDNIRSHSGTPGFASPEQLRGDVVDEQSDIYSLGRLIRLISRHIDLTTRVMVMPIWIRACVRNKKFRTKSVGSLYDCIMRLENSRRKKEKVISRTIAIVGSDTGVGCTHIAISLVSYLNQAGYRAFYRDEAQGRVLEEIYRNHIDWEVRQGIIYHDNFAGIMETGSAVNINRPQEGILVLDYGTVPLEFEADATIYVCDNAGWHKSIRVGEDMDIIICNRFSMNEARNLARSFQSKVYRYPYVADPMHITTGLKAMFSEMLKVGAGL